MSRMWERVEGERTICPGVEKRGILMSGTPQIPVIPPPACKTCWTEDVGKLILRFTVGGLMLFHGIHKLRHGVGWMTELLEARGLPASMAYGSYVGEVVAPLLMVVGILTRPAAIIVAGTMVMAVYLVLRDQVLTLTEHGGWTLELNAFFFLGAAAVLFLGPGRYSVSRGRGWWA